MQTNIPYFISLVKVMRKHQTDYFRTKSQQSLRYARNAENTVDSMIQQYERENIEKIQKKLF